MVWIEKWSTLLTSLMYNSTLKFYCGLTINNKYCCVNSKLWLSSLGKMSLLVVLPWISRTYPWLWFYYLWGLSRKSWFLHWKEETYRLFLLFLWWLYVVSVTFWVVDFYEVSLLSNILEHISYYNVRWDDYMIDEM